MRVYLDNCVFQDLKKEENAELLALIKASKGEMVYFFSEAHLQDLTRDESYEKYSDMDFLVQIVDDNCMSYNKTKVQFNLCTPREYYDSFEWGLNYHKDFMSDSFLSIFKTIPLDFNSLIVAGEAVDAMPNNLKNVLLRPTNLYDFMIAMLDLTESLTQEQKEFKELLKYLHENSLTYSLYKQIGIDGYDGKDVVDIAAFRDSFYKYILKEKENGLLYDVFFNMYTQLEFLAIVKGKPKRQKFMNMINDSKHGYYGCFCDIVVSKDIDFIRKLKLMYEILQVNIKVYDISEFSEFLNKKQLFLSSNFDDLIEEIDFSDDKEIRKEMDEEGNEIWIKPLSKLYFGYFDIQIQHSNGNLYFSKEDNKSFTSGTLIKEIEYSTNKLIELLGQDNMNLGQWQKGEMKEDRDWQGRSRGFTNVFVVLCFTSKLIIMIGKTE